MLVLDAALQRLSASSWTQTYSCGMTASSWSFTLRRLLALSNLTTFLTVPQSSWVCRSLVRCMRTSWSSPPRSPYLIDFSDHLVSLPQPNDTLFSPSLVEGEDALLLVLVHTPLTSACCWTVSLLPAVGTALLLPAVGTALLLPAVGTALLLPAVGTALLLPAVGTALLLFSLSAPPEPLCGSLQLRVRGLPVWHLRHHCVIVGSR